MHLAMHSIILSLMSTTAASPGKNDLEKCSGGSGLPPGVTHGNTAGHMSITFALL